MRPTTIEVSDRHLSRSTGRHPQYPSRMSVPLRTLRACPIELAGESVALLPQRALWWKSRQWLVIADLHVGKSESYRRQGVAIPEGILEEMLARLDAMITALAPERLVVLGDLVHDLASTDSILRRQVAETLGRLAAPAIIVRGNHDRSDAFPKEWKLEDVGNTYDAAPFRFEHHPSAKRERYTLAGHLHPTIAMGSRTDHLRLPCFHFGPRIGVLPAFSRFSRGVPMVVDSGDRAFLIAEGEIVPVADERDRRNADAASGDPLPNLAEQ